MKIHDQLPLPGAPEPASGVPTRRPENQLGHAPATGQDPAGVPDVVTHLSTLATQLASVSEQRQAHLHSLQQAIQTGQYRIDPDQVAQAMLREWGWESEEP